MNPVFYGCDATFKVVNGLAGQGTVSFQSANYPSRYIRHSSYLTYITINDGTELFGNDASFTVENGLYGEDTNSVSFKSLNYPSYYLRHQNSQLRISSESDAVLYRKDASWIPLRSTESC